MRAQKMFFFLLYKCENKGITKNKTKIDLKISLTEFKYNKNSDI